MYTLITEPVESSLRAMGEALLRVADRRQAALGRRPVSAESRLFMSSLMAAFAAADEDGSVCIRLADLIRYLIEKEDRECSLLNDSDEPWLLDMIRVRLEALRAEGLIASAKGTEDGVTPTGEADDPREEARAPILFDEADPYRESRLYFSRAFEEEKGLAQALLKLAASPARELPEAVAAKAAELTRAIRADSLQQAAVTTALAHGFSVICGGPGTGKTTTVVLILECLLTENPDLRIYLAAPTGKATSRMRQSIQGQTEGALKDCFPRLKALADGTAESTVGLVEERTIHKWLVTNTPTGKRPSADNPLACDVLIIDEASMVDVHLAARLFRVIDPKTRVIVLGDKHQLAAVGPGAVFADMSDKDGALASHVVELKKSRRFKEKSIIARLAAAINHDGLGRKRATDEVKAILRRQSDPGDSWHVAWDNADIAEDGLGIPERAQAWLTTHLENYCAALMAYLETLDQNGDTDAARTTLWNTLQTFRPLCARRRGILSVEAVNAFAEKFVRKALEDAGRFDQRLDAVYYPGKVLIVRRNDDMLGVFNGDVGIVLPMKTKDGDGVIRTVYFGDSGRRIPPALLPSHDTAFAMTIHQSQGSEFDNVAVFLPSEVGSGLATRELLYTGVTRTKASVEIFGSEDVLDRSVETPTIRVSGLAKRMTEAAARLRA